MPGCSWNHFLNLGFLLSGPRCISIQRHFLLRHAHCIAFSQCAESHFPVQELERGLDTMLDAYGAAGSHLEQPGEAQGPSAPQPAAGTRKKPARPSKKPRGAAGELDESHRVMHSNHLQSIQAGEAQGPSALAPAASTRKKPQRPSKNTRGAAGECPVLST